MLADLTSSAALNRRDIFRSAAAVAAGSVLLAEYVGAQENPAANVADRGADIRISALRGFMTASGCR